MTLYHYLMLSGALFAVGLFGALTRRNLIGILMSIVLMLNAANINLAAFNRFLHFSRAAGHMAAIFVIIAAAAQVVAGLALIMAVYKNTRSIYAEKYNKLKG